MDKDKDKDKDEDNRKRENDMRTLEQVREENGSCLLLFSGMEKEPIELPSIIKDREQEVYQNFIKPVSRKTWAKHLDK